MSRAEVLDYLRWFEGEVSLHGVDYRPRLPTLDECHWATRGPFPWPLPWGTRFDPTFCASVRMEARSHAPVGSYEVDCSPWGVFDLASSVSEFTQMSVGDTVIVFGGDGTGDSFHFRFALTNRRIVREAAESDIVGFRVVLEPDDEPRTRPILPPGQSDARLAAAWKALGPVEELAATPQGRAVKELAKPLLDAFRAATFVVAADPDSALAWHLRGVARRHLGDGLGCTWDAWEAVRLAPERPEVWLNRAYAHARPAGDPERALADVEQALRLDPSHLLARGLRGELLLRLGRHAEGQRELAQVLAAFAAEAPDSPLVATRVQALRELYARSLAPPAAAEQPASGEGGDDTDGD